MTRKHGVTDEDVRRDEEKDERNYRRAKEGAEEGGCCLLYLFASTSCVGAVAFVPLLMR